MHMDKANINFSNGNKNFLPCPVHPALLQSFSNSSSLVRERLKSYPRVSEISLSCTPPGVRFYISHLSVS